MVGAYDRFMVLSGEELLLPDAKAWWSWLERNHDTTAAVWLVLTKKGGTVTQLTYADALDAALCFGWIDGKARGRDDQTSSQRWTPRGARSRWSKRNVDHVARLESQGLMTPAGRAAVEAAKADGRWEAAYHGPANAQAPDDLLAAIGQVPAAQAMYDVLTSQNRYALYYRLSTIKTAEARDRRIASMVEMLARHEAPHPQKRRPQ